MSDRRRGLLTLVAAAAAYLALMVLGITAVAAEEEPAVPCDITATVGEDSILTITHLSPLPGPGWVQVVTYDAAGPVGSIVFGPGGWVDVAGVMLIEVSVAGLDHVVVLREMPPAGGLCEISVPVPVVTEPITEPVTEPVTEPAPDYAPPAYGEPADSPDPPSRDALPARTSNPEVSRVLPTR